MPEREKPYKSETQKNQKRSFASFFKPSDSNPPIEVETKNKQSLSLGPAEMASITDAGTIVIGKVRELSLIENIYTVCKKKSFLNVDIKYIGGSWVWLEFDNKNVCNKFKQHDDMQYYFTTLNPLNKHFVVDDEVIWISIEGLPLCAWSVAAFKTIAAKWGEVVFVDNDGEGPLCNGRVRIKIKNGRRVDEEMMGTIDGIHYPVWVKELGQWEPKIHNPLEDCKGDFASTSDDESNESPSEAGKESEVDLTDVEEDHDQLKQDDMQTLRKSENVNVQSNDNKDFPVSSFSATSTSSIGGKKVDYNANSLIEDMSRFINIGDKVKRRHISKICSERKVKIWAIE
ncbi:RNA-directed DNA polymerase, eukaryota [Tanacetum coccineum]